MDKIFQIKFYKYNLLKWECKEHDYYVEAPSVKAIKKHRVFRWILGKEFFEIPKDLSFDVKDSISTLDLLLDPKIYGKYENVLLSRGFHNDKEFLTNFIKTALFIIDYFKRTLNLEDNDKIYFFWETTEGFEKDGIEEMSGCILTESGLIDSFWLKYNDEKDRYIESAQLYGGSMPIPQPYRVKNLTTIKSLNDCRK